MLMPKKFRMYCPPKKATLRIATMYIQARRAVRARSEARSSAVRVRKTGIAPNGLTMENKVVKVASRISIGYKGRGRAGPGGKVLFCRLNGAALPCTQEGPAFFAAFT